MPVSIEPSELPKIARAAGKSGKELPDWAVGKPELEKAYYEGAGVTPPEPSKAVETRKPTAPEQRPRTQKAPSAGQGQAPSTTGGLSSGPSRASIRSAFKGATGSTGGVLIAVFLYPIVLAGIKDGPSGVNAWLYAKFLNRVTAPTTTTKGKK